MVEQRKNKEFDTKLNEEIKKVKLSFDKEQKEMKSYYEKKQKEIENRFNEEIKIFKKKSIRQANLWNIKY